MASQTQLYQEFLSMINGFSSIHPTHQIQLQGIIRQITAEMDLENINSIQNWSKLQVFLHILWSNHYNQKEMIKTNNNLLINPATKNWKPEVQQVIIDFFEQMNFVPQNREFPYELYTNHYLENIINNFRVEQSLTWEEIIETYGQTQGSLGGPGGPKPPTSGSTGPLGGQTGRPPQPPISLRPPSPPRSQPLLSLRPISPLPPRSGPVGAPKPGR